METYAVLRRNGWRTSRDLQEAVLRSIAAGDAMPADVRWIRSYVTSERGGSVGTFCIYQATDPEAIRRHAGAADLPIDEIVAIADTVVHRPDPMPQGARR